MKDRIINVAEVAGFLGVKVSWVYDNYRSEGIPSYRVGRGLRFRQSDLEKWLDARKDAA